MKSLAPSRLTLTELASAAGLSENAVRYRVRVGQITAPDAAGLFDRERALAEVARKARQAGGRKRGPTKLADAAARLPRDPAERFRLARARQEEMKLRKMWEELVEVAAVQKRTYALFRMVRDRLDAWVNRTAPTLAAALRADEGETWRTMQAEMRKLQGELASLDLEKAVAAVLEAGGDEGETTGSRQTAGAARGMPSCGRTGGDVGPACRLPTTRTERGMS